MIQFSKGFAVWYASHFGFQRMPMKETNETKLCDIASHWENIFFKEIKSHSKLMMLNVISNTFPSYV